MKRIERKHLKEDELVHTIAVTRGYIQSHGRTVAGVAIVIGLVAVVLIGMMVIRQRMEHQGEELLAQAMVALNARVVPAMASGAQGGVPAAAQIGATGTFATEEAKLKAALPALRAAADAYPESAPGIAARYHLAGALAALGRPEEAVAQFDQVVAHAGLDSLYGRMSQLGKADAQAHAGQVDAAIATWTSLAAANAPEVPQDAILMHLARAYAAKGNTGEARKTLTQLIEEHPGSPYSAEARSELEALG